MSSLPFTPRPLALLVASLALSPAWAQQSTGGNTPARSEHQMSAVIVTGQAEPVTVSEGELQRKQPENIQDVFEDIPNVQVDSMNVTGEIGDIEIRGMGGTYSGNYNRVTMEIDGMEVGQAFGYGHTSAAGREFLDPADLKEVSVDKGPGASGLAGSVRLRTKDPVDYLRSGQQWGGDVRLGGSSDKQSVNVGFGLASRFSEHSSAMLSYTRRSYREADNSGGQEGTGRGRTAQNPLETTSNVLNAKWVLSPSSDHRITLALQHVDTDRTNTYLSDIVSGRDRLSGARVEYLQSDRSSKNGRDALMLRHDVARPSAMFDTASWQLSWQRTNGENHDYSRTRVTPADTTKPSEIRESLGHGSFTTQDISLRTDFEKTFTAASLRHDLSYGLRISRSESDMDLTRIYITDGVVNPISGAREYFPRNEQMQVRLKVADRISLGDSGLSITPSLHANRIHIKPKMETKKAVAGTGDYKRTSVGGGLRLDWRVQPAHVLSLDLQRSTHLPGYGETNAQGAGHSTAVQLPNLKLKPEQGTGIELGWRSHGTLGHQKTAIFYNRYSNQFTTECDRTKKPVVCTQANQAENTTIRGIEWSGTLDLAALNLPKGLKLSGALAYTKGESTSGKPMPSVNPLNGYVGLRYDAPSDRWGVDARLRFEAGKKAKDLPEKGAPLPSPGWATLDLRMHFNPTKNLRIDAGIYNLLDKEYVKWSSARNIFNAKDTARWTEPGTNLSVNMRYQF